MRSDFEPKIFVHGAKLTRKASATGDKDLATALKAYQKWKKGSLAVIDRTEQDIEKLVELLNIYKDTVEPLFDNRDNSAQEVLQPSILEEFFEYLFAPIAREIGVDLPIREPSAGFLELVFNPKNVQSLASLPEYTIRRKDHDFILGSAVSMSLSDRARGATKVEEIVVPAVAIEVKRYLERNMLDECAGTASRVKGTTPYCLYIIVAEYLKMDDCRPELSAIDEIYVLRRQKNSERISNTFSANPIYADLIVDIYTTVLAHLKRIWWDPDSALTTGKLFGLTKR